MVNEKGPSNNPETIIAWNLFNPAILLYVAVERSCTITATVMATAAANLGGVQVASPKPMDKWDHPGMGEAEFFPLCIAAGCSPAKIIFLIYSIL